MTRARCTLVCASTGVIKDLMSDEKNKNMYDDLEVQAQGLEFGVASHQNCSRDITRQVTVSIMSHSH